jgi:hypothetical protein
MDFFSIESYHRFLILPLNGLTVLKKAYSALTFLFFFLIFANPSQVSGQETYRDNFSSTSYSNNDGTQNFAAGWSENSDDNNPSNGKIRITSNQLRFDNLDAATISRTLDLSSAITVTLTLDYDATSRGNEGLDIELWNNSSSSWQTVATINTSNTGTISYSLTSNQISASSAIRFSSSSGNWGSGERIYVDNVQFLVTALSANEPPVIAVTGDQVYCPGSSIPVVESVNITDPDDTTAPGVSIQISSGYVNGEDLLTLTGTHPSITPSWSATEGKLTLTGPATLAEFETAVSSVEYSSSAPSPTGSRGFSITVGDANYLPFTGHFYEFVAAPGITWTSARDAAAIRTYYGLQGYLATLTSQVEADFSGSQALGVGWIGANDDTTEGDWQWVTGPEAGTSFWSGGVGGTELTFAFWNANEPNDYPDGPTTPGEENFAHITDPSVTTSPGSWNDLPNAGGGGAYAPQGYVVEYGGTSGDPVLNISGNTLITIDNVNPTASNPATVVVYCPADIPSQDVTVVTDEADNCTIAPSVTFVGDTSDGGSDPETITRTYRVTDDSGNSVDVTQAIEVYSTAVGTQPADQATFAGINAQFDVVSSYADTFQWQVSSNGGGSFTNVSDGPEYSGTTTATLTVLSPEIDKNGYVYRVIVSNSTSGCSAITSADALLTVNVQAIITNRRITYRLNPN